MVDIQFVKQNRDDEFYMVRANEAIRYFERSRTKEARKKMLQVIAGLCRQAYHHGQADERNKHGW